MREWVRRSRQGPVEATRGYIILAAKREGIQTRLRVKIKRVGDAYSSCQGRHTRNSHPVTDPGVLDCSSWVAIS